MPGLYGIGAGTDRLGFQSRQRPVFVHLVGHNALYIVFNIHHVDNRQSAVGVWAVLKAAGVLIALAPGLRVPSHGADAETVAVVPELEQDLPTAGLRHRHAVSGAGSLHGDGGLVGLVQIDELPVLVIVAEFVSGPHGVFQIGGFQSRVAPADAHLQGVIDHGGRRNGSQAEQSDDKQKGQHTFFHKTSQWRIP